MQIRARKSDRNFGILKNSSFFFLYPGYECSCSIRGLIALFKSKRIRICQKHDITEYLQVFLPCDIQNSKLKPV